MADAPGLAADQHAEGDEIRDRDDELEKLRALVVGPEQRQLAALRERVEDRARRARDVSAVLPQALQLRGLDADLARALTPPVERAITASVRRNPKPLADALFPVMGPAIRKAVSASLAAMVDSLNRTLEHSLSWRSLTWRVEALRTGRSFGEIVLLNTLLYRVEQVFLIDRTSGLLLQHVHAGASSVQDAELVSGMLTAIGDFVRDSFRVSDHASLDEFQVGDLTVLVEQGPRALVAAVVRGSAPPELRGVLQSTLEAVHLQMGEALETFDGETAAFESVRPALESCLQAQYRTGPARGARRLWWVVGVLVAAFALWGGMAWRERARWARYVETLRAEPGLVVLSAGPSGGRYVVSGLRDPLARDPETLRAGLGLGEIEVEGRWEPYHALQPAFVLARARSILQPPPGATLELSGGVLKASGRAPLAWVAQARRLAPLIPGVTDWDASPILDAEVEATTARIARATPLFLKGSSQLAPGQEAVVIRLREALRGLDVLAAAAGRRFRVDFIGHTDADGAPEANVPLSRARAQRLLDAVSIADAGQLEFAVEGHGSSEPLAAGRTEDEKRRNRRVAIRVTPLNGDSRGGARP